MEWSKQGLETANSTSNCGWGLKLKGRTRGGTGNTSGTASGFSIFFSSRRRHTRYWRDWSSDVCSSDLRTRSTRTARTTGSAHRLGAVTLRLGGEDLAELLGGTACPHRPDEGADGDQDHEDQVDRVVQRRVLHGPELADVGDEQQGEDRRDQPRPTEDVTPADVGAHGVEARHEQGDGEQDRGGVHREPPATCALLLVQRGQPATADRGDDPGDGEGRGEQPARAGPAPSLAHAGVGAVDREREEHDGEQVDEGHPSREVDEQEARDVTGQGPEDGPPELNRPREVR